MTTPAEDHGSLSAKYRTSSGTKHAHLRPSGKTPHAFKPPIGAFHNRSQLINSLFFRKALSRVHLNLNPEQQTLMDFFSVNSVEMMHTTLARYLEDRGEEGVKTISDMAPNVIKDLHMCRQREIIKQHKLHDANGNYSYVFPAGDRGWQVPPANSEGINLPVHASQSQMSVSAIAVELESA